MAIQAVTSGMTPVLPPVATPRPARSAEPNAAPTTTSESTPTTTTKPSTEQVQEALREIRRVVGPVAQNLQFSIDEESGKTVVKIVDSSTKEVVRQMPSEELLAIAHALDRLKGLLLKQKA